MRITLLLFVIFFAGSLLTCEDEESTTPVDPRDDIAIKWNVEEYSEEFDYQYFTCTIKKDSLSSNKILMYNFANLGEHVVTEGYLKGDSISIPYQEPDDNPISGGGIVSESLEHIDFTYTIDFGSGNYEFSATFNRGPIAGMPNKRTAFK